MIKINKMISALVLLLLLPALQSCTEEKPDPVDAVFSLLADAEYEATLIQIESAREDGAEEADLKLAEGLARFGQLFDRISLVMSLVANVVDNASTVADFQDDGITTAGDAREEDYINGLVSTLLQEFRVLTGDAADAFEAAADANVDRQVDGLMFYMVTIPWLDLSGHWNADDARMMGGLLGIAAGSVMVLQSIDLRFNLYTVAQTVVGPVEMDGPHIVGMFAKLVNDPAYPNFLGVSPLDVDEDGEVDGTVLPGKARVMLQKSFASLARIMATPGLGNIFVVEMPYDEYSLRVKDVMDVDANGKFDLNGGGFRADYELNYKEKLPAALEQMAASFASVDGTQRISLKDDLLQVLIPVVFSLLKYVSLSETLDNAISSLSLDTNPDLAITAMGEILVPYGVAFAAGAGLDHLAGVRTLFPPANTHVEDSEINFVLEWECPWLLDSSAVTGTASAFPDGSLTCEEYDTDKSEYPKATYRLISGSHFDNVQSPVDAKPLATIADDEIESRYPYIPFPDATFSDLLWLKTDVYLEDGGAWKPATSFSLNAWIAALSDKLDSLPF